MDNTIPQNVLPCIIEGCERPLLYKRTGLCYHHYMIQRAEKVDTLCSTPECGRKVLNVKRGLCRRCYMYWLTIEAPHKPRCPIEGCDRPIWVHGFCNIHYRRGKRIGGDPTQAPGSGRKGIARYGIRALKGENITSHGYRKIRVKKPGEDTVYWILEHRYVMEQHLGRPLLASENVHHKDGDKLNNDISNLELWINIPQPHGIRAEDAVAWAREILQRYG